MKKTSTQQKTVMIKYLGTIDFRRIVRELRAIKSLVGYGLFFYLMLGVVASPKANAGAICRLDPGKSAAILNSSGQVIGTVTGPQEFNLESGDTSNPIIEYRIYIRRDAWLTVYRIRDTNQYIDINSFRNPPSCMVWAPQPARNDIRKSPPR